jgi:hypothetical protein
MSATNRGAERVEDDAYPTPAWPIRRLLERVELPRGNWREPCAGDGAIVRVVDSVLGPQQWHLIDIRDTSEQLRLAAPTADINAPADYLTGSLDSVDVVMTNPPFSLAERVIKQALTEAPWVVMLLRLNFLGSDDRSSWLRHEMPDIYTLPDRPSFIASYKCKPRDEHDRGCGWKMKTPIAAPRIKRCPICDREVQRSTSDSAEYCWAVWGPDRGRTVSRVQILDSTPREERAA